jgi:hypothetical protein
MIMGLRRLYTFAAVVASATGLTSRCDDLPWASERSHAPVGEKNGTYTAQTGYSWHIHYLHYTYHEESLVEAFQRDFCEAFAIFGEGGAVQPSPWGPNDIAPGGEYVVGTCDPEGLALRSRGYECGNGTCPTTPTSHGVGPWSICQNEFFVPATRIDAVTVGRPRAGDPRRVLRARARPGDVPLGTPLQRPGPRLQAGHVRRRRPRRHPRAPARVGLHRRGHRLARVSLHHACN